MPMGFQQSGTRCTASIFFACAALTIGLLVPEFVYAQSERVAVDPPTLSASPEPMASLKTMFNSESVKSQSGEEKILDLTVKYIENRMWNPATSRFDSVRLRGYYGGEVDPQAPYVAPTIEVVPGDTVRLTLKNQLPPEQKCIDWEGDVNKPHCFNSTNMHTHGLWVNPAGNSDNVLISVHPNVEFQYEYNIPPDHPSGTFWYHPHLHGSTALQVSSGMAGALLIRGDRVPSDTGHGDLDVLLDSDFAERILVFQQIQYACRDENGKIQRNDDKSYMCEEGQFGTIEGYDQFGPGSWPESGRYTSINGQVLPILKDARAGEVERWRMVHAGVRDTISLQFRKHKPKAVEFLGLSAKDNDAYVERNCEGEPVPYHLVAADGLTMAAAQETEVAIFQPGYRWDALVIFPEPGDYCVIDAAAPTAGSINEAKPSRQLLALLSVTEGPEVHDLSERLEEELISAAKRTMPSGVASQVVADLQDGLKLHKFVPHPAIEDSEVDGCQELTFNIDISKKPPEFQIDGEPYKPSRIDRVLKLGGVDEWKLRSDFVAHPFHIHVNPFQVVKILDPNGKDVSGPASLDSNEGVPDPQYRGLRGVWKDTLLVKQDYEIVIRTRYQRYIGDFVLHCHILDHEDKGMMQNVRILLPDASGNASPGHHH